VKFFFPERSKAPANVSLGLSGQKSEEPPSKLLDAVDPRRTVEQFSVAILDMDFEEFAKDLGSEAWTESTLAAAVSRLLDGAPDSLAQHTVMVTFSTQSRLLAQTGDSKWLGVRELFRIYFSTHLPRGIETKLRAKFIRRQKEVLAEKDEEVPVSRDPLQDRMKPACAYISTDGRPPWDHHHTRVEDSDRSGGAFDPTASSSSIGCDDRAVSTLRAVPWRARTVERYAPVVPIEPLVRAQLPWEARNDNRPSQPQKKPPAAKEKIAAPPTMNGGSVEARPERGSDMSVADTSTVDTSVAQRDSVDVDRPVSQLVDETYLQIDFRDAKGSSRFFGGQQTVPRAQLISQLNGSSEARAAACSVLAAQIGRPTGQSEKNGTSKMFGPKPRNTTRPSQLFSSLLRSPASGRLKPNGAAASGPDVAPDQNRDRVVRIHDPLQSGSVRQENTTRRETPSPVKHVIESDRSDHTAANGDARNGAEPKAGLRPSSGWSRAPVGVPRPLARPKQSNASVDEFT
jgi:hypothetical protein